MAPWPSSSLLTRLATSQLKVCSGNPASVLVPVVWQFLVPPRPVGTWVLMLSSFAPAVPGIEEDDLAGERSGGRQAATSAQRRHLDRSRGLGSLGRNRARSAQKPGPDHGDQGSGAEHT